jgi:hypothetical protein
MLTVSQTHTLTEERLVMSMLNQRELESDIISYLMKNPEAKDTAEGIAQFWLPPHHQSVALEEVERVLDELVKESKLTVVAKGNESKVVYRLKR